MKRKVGLVMAVMFALVATMGAYAGGGGQRGDRHVIRVGVGHPANHTFTQAFERFKTYAEERSDGRLDIQIFHSNQLGNEREMQEQVSLGTIEITVTGVLVAFEPLLAVYELPYLFDNRDHIRRFHQSQAAIDVARRLEPRNIMLKGYFENGFRQITNSVRPISTPEDVRGLVIRTPENPAQMETFRQLGALVTPMPFGELYTALQQGVVDGQENPLQNIAHGRFQEVQSHLAITNHIYNSAYLIVGRRWLESLPADLREIVVSGLRMAEEWQMAEAYRLDSHYLQYLRNSGIQITTPNIDAFRTAVMPVHQTFINQFGRDAQVILDAINATR